MKNIIKDIVSLIPTTVVRPREFFIAWSGVPTLAYDGFTPSLLKIKSEIGKQIKGLKKEKPGSKWPKTTLGALRDDRSLSWDDLLALRDICDKMNDKIVKDEVFNIEQLQAVIFQCRSLEKRLISYSIDLDKSQEPDIDATPEPVDETMAQFARDNLEKYWPSARKDGGRESHYRLPYIEATLVYDLPAEQPLYIDEFTKQVDRKLKGIYCWFLPKSRHMTVRALACD